MSSALFTNASIITSTKNSFSIFSLHPSSNSIKQLTFLNDNCLITPRHTVATTLRRVSSASSTVSTDNKLASGWEEFCVNVSGEWDGFGADFTTEGKPIELPESVTPEAYREWEVKVFDWQTQCPTLAQSSLSSSSIDRNEKDPSSVSFFYKTIKLLPTVGCEADAATTYSIDERHIVNPSYDQKYRADAFVYQSNGSYVALWRSNPTTSSTIFEVEHCLVQPGTANDDDRSRARVIQVLQLQENDDHRSLKLVGLKVFVEQWYGPFRNGDQLGGCSIRDTAFAATQPLKAAQVTGHWGGQHLVAAFPTSDQNSSNRMIQELGGECMRQTKRDEPNFVLLPKQLWCSTKTTENKETCCEVGWLLDQGRAISSKCTFSSHAKLQEIAMATETIIPDQ